MECLAALVKLFPEEVEKKAPDGRTLRLILSTFAAPVRLERLLNFRRARQHIVRKDVDYLAIGTTTNEALHRELNRAFDQVHNLYKATLTLRLGIFQLYKLLPHNRAQYGRGLRGASQALMLSRCVGSVAVWNPREWRAWCSKLGVRVKADLPLAESRAVDAGVVREAAAAVKARPAASVSQLLKRPASAIVALSSRARPPPKKTPFARPSRMGGLVRMGKALKQRGPPKRSGVAKRPAAAAQRTAPL